MRVKAVTFDAGGTLITSWPSVGHIYAEVAARHGWPGVSVKALNRQFTEAWHRRKNFNHTRAEWADLVTASFRGLMPAPPSRALFRELYERFSQPQAWHVFEDVLPALRTLSSRGFKLGVISNWDRRLGPLLRRLVLREFFDVVVVSCNVGSAKPSPAIFRCAADRLALPREAILHVGDSLEMDLHGAQRAGLQAVLLCRGTRVSAAGQIRSLAELC